MRAANHTDFSMVMFLKKAYVDVPLVDSGISVAFKNLES